uniref:RELT like 1 n=1 Tax=Corvus moneduloides TaxID=1196302 RepID=A0A8U7MI35_CORMO
MCKKRLRISLKLDTGTPSSAVPHGTSGRAGAAEQHRLRPAAPRRRRAGRARPAAAGPGRAAAAAPLPRRSSAGTASGMAPAATGGIPPTAPSLGLTGDWLGSSSALEMNESMHENSDTVGQIVNYIMKNEANADVLKAMVADSSVFEPESPLSPTSPESPMSPGTPLSPGVVPFRHSCKGHHFHTVGGVVEKDVCTRCSHKRWHLIKPAQKSKENRRSRIGEVTVLSVGRFRVTKVDHKSNSKERKSLMSVTGVESVNGEMPATPAKQEVSEAPASPVKQEMQERRSSE